MRFFFFRTLYIIKLVCAEGTRNATARKQLRQSRLSKVLAVLVQHIAAKTAAAATPISMISSHRLVFAFTAALVSSPSFAVEPTLTQGGFVGLEITPNARLLDWGRMAIAYDRQLPGGVPSTGNNYVLGFGLLPNVEVSGRVAANRNPDNCFKEPCKGIRDLSASGKIGIGLDAANRFHVALGATDLGGAATNFRSYYGVLTYDGRSYEASAGYARRSTDRVNGPASPLDGPFASAAWQPLPWVRGQLEYTDGNGWAGVRLFAPARWLPEGWSAHVGANARLTSSNVTERTWFSAGISIPLPVGIRRQLRRALQKLPHDRSCIERVVAR
jgi:hypothetical protein